MRCPYPSLSCRWFLKQLQSVLNKIMSGRGRELTLPSWMTSGNAIDAVAAPQVNLAAATSSLPLPVTTAMPFHPQLPVVPVVPLNQTVPNASYPVVSSSYSSGFQQHSFPPAFYSVMPAVTNLSVAKGPMPPTAPAPVIGDPNNNASYWGEHVAPDSGRKYWYNRVSLTSTYEKPFCLKTPEERSIPPCRWKEYTADGKTYYSNGTEST